MEIVEIISHEVEAHLSVFHVNSIGCLQPFIGEKNMKLSGTAKYLDFRRK